MPLSALRNQVLSSNKYVNGLFLGSTDKIVPLNSFVTKRMWAAFIVLDYWYFYVKNHEIYRIESVSCMTIELYEIII